MMYCLDTDIIIEFLKGNPRVVQKLNTLKSRRAIISITFLTLYELYKGVHTSPKPKEDLQNLMQLLEEIELINISQNSSDISGKIYADLRNKGELHG